MEVDEHYRRRGCGCCLIHELKRACYDMGRIPAARCNLMNTASRATLQTAGLLRCARILRGIIPEKFREKFNFRLIFRST